MNAETMQMFIVLFGLLIIALVLLYATGPRNPVVRARLERIEAFEGGSGSAAPKVDPEGATDSLSHGLSPDDAKLDSPRAPAALLGDTLPVGEPGRFVSPSAAACYDADFQKRIEVTGNFRQLTNNYKRSTPDSCSAPTHELVLNFYKTEPLPFSGCLRS